MTGLVWSVAVVAAGTVVAVGAAAWMGWIMQRRITRAGVAS